MIDNLTMGSVVRRNAKQYPSRTAIIYEDRRYTYTEYNERVNRAANMLRTLGIDKGDGVSIMGKNSIEYLESCHACAKIGAVFGTVNWRLAPKEISFIVTDAESKVFLIEAGLQEKIPSILSELKNITFVVYDGNARLPGAYSYDELTTNATTDEPDHEVSSTDPALIMYTSGTTGLPKGALLTHQNVLWDAISYLTYAAPRHYDSLLVGMPMNHVSGLHMLTTAFLIRGLPLVVMRQWDPEEACKLIQRYRPTQACILVTALQQLIEFPRLNEYDLGSLDLVLTAAAKYTKEFPIQVMNALRVDRLLFGYGLTEAAPIVTITEFSGEMLAHENTLGFPVWYNDLRIVDEQDRDVPVGEIGEILVRGPNVFRGYFKRDKANAEILRGDWLHTGDLAYADADNFLYFVDRSKDMIKSGGFNVYSLEVELALLRAVPELAEVAVIGMPDDTWGEAVHAFVVLKEGAAITQDEIISRSREHLAGFKLPKQVHFMDELPKNVSGKVLKRTLHDAATAHSVQGQASAGGDVVAAPDRIGPE